MGTTQVSLILSRQPSARTTEKQPSAIPDGIIDPPKLQSLCSQLLPQIDILCKHMNAKFVTAQESYKSTLDRTVRHTLQFYSARHVSVYRSQAEVTGLARIAEAPVANLLPKTLEPCKVVSATPDTVKVDESSLLSTVSIGRVAVPAYNTKGHDGRERASPKHNANYPINNDKTDQNDLRITGEVPEQQTVEHIGAAG